jgi:hypothetical protein
MPRIDLRRESIPRIGDLREVVVICTMLERPDGNVSTIVDRPGVIRVHARVRPLDAQQILDYQTVYPGMGRGHAQVRHPTVEVTIRVPPDVKIDLNHWVFHANRYTETWYKVAMVKDMGGVLRWLQLFCWSELVRDVRNDPATQEPPPRFEVPEMAGLPNVVDRI